MEAVEQQTLVDTDVLVNFLRGKNTKLLELQETGIHVSAVTCFELFFGALRSQKPKQNYTQTQKLVERVHVHPFTNQTATTAAKIHAQLLTQGNPVDIRDLFIAATALEHDLAVHTNNKKHFSKIPGLTLT